MDTPIFTTIILFNGSKCDILEVRPYIIWKATYRQLMNTDKKLDFIPFLLEQVLIIDGKKVNMEFIGNMNIHDYIKITEVLNAFMINVENF